MEGITLAIVGLSQFNGTTIFSNNNGSRSFVGGGTIANTGSLDFTANVTISFNTLTINGSGSIGSASTATGTINSTSTLTVNPGATATVGQVNLSIGSTASVQGSLLLSNTARTKTITGNTTVGAAGSINFSVAETLDISGDLITAGIQFLAIQEQVERLPLPAILYLPPENLLLRGLVQLSVLGNFNVANTAIVDTATGSTPIVVGGNWNVTSSATNPFVEGTNTVTFRGTTLQTITTTEAGGENFYNVIFNNTSGLATGVSSAVNINARSLSVTNGNIDMNGFDVTITGDASASTDNLIAGSIFSSQPGTDFLITDASGTKSVQLDGTTLGSATQPITINVTGSIIEFDGSDFFANGTGAFTKTGSTDDYGDGGSVFTGNFSLTTQAGRWIMGDGIPDIFTGTTTLNNNGSGNNWIIGRASTGNEFRGPVILNNTKGGFAFGRNNGNGTVRSALFMNSVSINQQGAGTIVFADSDATYSSNVTFQGDITLTSIVGANGAISFGTDGIGSITLTSTSRFNISPGSVLGNNTVTLRRLTQNGTTLTQNITLSATNVMDVGVLAGDGCTFNAPVNFRAHDLRLRYNAFNGVSTFTQTGTNGTNANNGGNITSAAATFTNQGTKIWRLGAVAADDFNGDVTFIRTGSAAIEPAYTNNSTFAGNISTAGSNAIITFGNNGGRVTIDGASKALTADALFPPVFTQMTMNGGAFTLNTSLSITTDLTLISGVINTTSANLLTLNAGSGISGTPSNTSHVDGPVKKLGNTQFVFPTGDNGIYRAIEISAPSNPAHFFTAEFFRGSHPYTNTVASNLISVTTCEYWNLAQSSGGSNVSVTLNWNTPDCTPAPYITDPSGLVVAQWSGSLWTNQGNSATSGNATTGSVTSLGAVTSYGGFALGSTKFSNPLPIELLNFSAEVNEHSIDLLWSTASERNNDYFTIQRSKEGHEFESITQIYGAANGDSNQQLNYFFNDVHPFDGVSYYRLKQTDFDGLSTLSNVIKVDRNQIKRLVVYPNPASSTQTISTSFTGSFHVFNSVGELVIQSNNTNSLNFKELAPGVYIVKSDKGLSAKVIIR